MTKKISMVRSSQDSSNDVIEIKVGNRGRKGSLAPVEIEEIDDYEIQEEHTLDKIKRERKNFFAHIGFSVFISLISLIGSIVFLVLHVWQRVTEKAAKIIKTDDSFVFTTSTGFFVAFAMFLVIFVLGVLYCLGRTVLLVLLFEHDRSLLIKTIDEQEAEKSESEKSVK